MRESSGGVFYAKSYHPIQAGSIDGTDILPHDNAIYRAFLCSSAALYDPFGDPKLIGDPYCTVFVGRLSHSTTEQTLHHAMSKYGKVKNLRLVRDIVTGASRGYAFVEYETEREMRRAYMDGHHSFIDDSEVLVDYNRQQLMRGWIPRRLGGGLGGRKESGQLRFGGRERPFRAPLQSIPFDELKRLGISPPPEGRYMSRFQVPSPPRRNRSSIEKESSHRRRSRSTHKEEYRHRSSSVEREEHHSGRSTRSRERRHRSRSMEREEHYSRSKEDYKEKAEYHKGSSVDRSEPLHGNFPEREDYHYSRSSLDTEMHNQKGNLKVSEDKFSDFEGFYHTSCRDRKESSGKRHKHSSKSDRHKSRRRDHSSER